MLHHLPIDVALFSKRMAIRIAAHQLSKLFEWLYRMLSTLLKCVAPHSTSDTPRTLKDTSQSIFYSTPSTRVELSYYFWKLLTTIFYHFSFYGPTDESEKKYQINTRMHVARFHEEY